MAAQVLDCKENTN